MAKINARKGHKGFQSVPLAERFWAKVDKRGPDECWHWIGCRDSGGYGQFFVGTKPNRGKRSHRIAWELHHGHEFPAGLLACHSCDNPACCNPAHIWPGTHRDNMIDAMRKGRINPKPPSKLSLSDVRIIRKLRAEGVRQADVARQFKVTPGTIRRIDFGETWQCR